MKILFVCTGNTCRSPMARGLAELYLPEEFEVFSAGINALEGDQASPKAVEVLKEKGIDLSRHTAVRVTEGMLRSADYIFTMTKSQEECLGGLYPECRDKIKALGQWLGSVKEVIDPWGGSLEVYDRCMRDLDEMVKALALKFGKGTSPG